MLIASSKSKDKMQQIKKDLTEIRKILDKTVTRPQPKHI